MKKFCSPFQLLLFSLIAGSVTSAWAQVRPRTITGTVRDADSKELLPFGSVQLLGTKTGVSTTDKAQYRMEVPASQEQVRLVASYTGYRSDTVRLGPNKLRHDFYLQPLNSSLNEVVVSATMKEVTKLDSPIPVEVYSQTLFRKSPAPSLFESLNMVNGVQPQLNCNVCNTGDIHINGLEGPYTMVLIDGMPIVSALSTVYGLQGIPRSLVKRIEVVKGPASTLYGSEAVGGLINIITRDPASAPALQADMWASNLGELSLDASTGWRIRKASALLGLNYFRYLTPHDINNDNFTDVTQQERVSVFNKWDFSRSKGRPASLGLRLVHENRWGGELQWTPEFRGSDSIYGESILTDRLELIGTYGLPIDSQNIRLDYSYNYHQQDSWYGTTTYFARQHTAFAQMVWNKQFTPRFSLLSGLPFRYIWYDDNSPATAAVADSTRSQPSLTILPGVFAQGEYQLTDRTTILAGLRYDHHNVHGSISTPRLSFKFSPNSQQTIRLTGGSGFRVVNLFTEDHAALTGARQVVIRNDLKPERSWNTNLNYSRFFNTKPGFLMLDGSLFYTYFSNRIVGDFFTDPDLIIYDNLAGHAVSKGVSLNADLAFTSGLKVLLGATYLDVYLASPDSLGQTQRVPQLFAPRFSGTFAASYTIQKIGLSIDWTGRLNGPMHLPVVPNDFRPEKSPWFCLMNMQVTKRLPRQMEVYAGVQNLLNFLPRHPILRPFDPFDTQASDPVSNPNGYTFDPTYNYAPVQGIKGILGFRWTFERKTAGE